MPSKISKITIDKISAKVIKSIRESFSYQGLLKALNSKIITKADIKDEALNEQKNQDLLMDQRVHTVLLNDLGRGGESLTKLNKVGQSLTKLNKVASQISQISSNNSNKEIESPRGGVDKDESLNELKKKLGQDFGPGWKGIDKDGDLMEVVELTDNGWVKFKVDKISGELDVFSYPVEKFLNELENDPVYNLDQEDAHDLATGNLKKLDNKGRLNLINRIHVKTLAKLQRIKSKQRDILEQVLRKSEDKKIQEVLAKINSG